MILTARFSIRRLPNRTKEVRFPGVNGHSVVDMGQDLYEIVQEGEADIAITDAGGNNDSMRQLMYQDAPGVMSGATPVDVDTLGQGIYSNCRLVGIETQRISPRIVRYRYTWRQMQAAADMTWPY